MKAIVLPRYGSTNALQIAEVGQPTPKKGEVLVKILATALNDYDWSMMLGKPYLYRLMFGILKPKQHILGMELAGIVEALGENTKSLKIGDAVYGDISEYGFGSFAEYICIDEKALALKPDCMSFEEAASIPHASMLAVQGLIDVGKIKQGERILINGAGGGVGSLGFQIAKLYGAEVTGVDTGDKLQMMQTIGFDHVIDYKQVDFTKNDQRYDLILDAKTCHSIFDYVRALNPGGRYVTVGGYLNRLLQTLIMKPLISKFSEKTVDIVALKANKDLAYISDLYKNGNIKAVIDGPYELSDVPERLEYFGAGKHTGKVVISVRQ